MTWKQGAAGPGRVAGRDGSMHCRCSTDLCSSHGKAHHGTAARHRAACCACLAVPVAAAEADPSACRAGAAGVAAVLVPPRDGSAPCQEIAWLPKSMGNTLEPTGIPLRARIREARPRPEGVHPSLPGRVNLGPKSRLGKLARRFPRAN